MPVYVYMQHCYSPTIVNTKLVDPLLPGSSVAVHVWVPVSPEWTACRVIIFDVVRKVLESDVHT